MQRDASSATVTVICWNCSVVISWFWGLYPPDRQLRSVSLPSLCAPLSFHALVINVRTKASLCCRLCSMPPTASSATVSVICWNCMCSDKLVLVPLRTRQAAEVSLPSQCAPLSFHALVNRVSSNESCSVMRAVRP